MRSSCGVPLILVCCVMSAESHAAIAIDRVYANDSTVDQDDMALWLHPDDTSLSTVIASDKTSNNLYVYSLTGELLQAVRLASPGNVDVRYGVTVGANCFDIVGLNVRTEKLIRLYRVDPATRLLEPIDNGGIDSGPNYGFTFFRHSDGRLFGFTGPKGTTTLRQFEFIDDGAGAFSGLPTAWEFTQTQIEGMVADDESGHVFLGEEQVGIWRVDAMDSTSFDLVAHVGDETRLTADVEGLALYHGAAGGGYLLASSQGASMFTVLERQPPHQSVGTFRILGVSKTDGIDVTNVAVPGFNQGMFLFHNGRDLPNPVQAIRWADVALEVPGLTVDTDSWDPRAWASCAAVETCSDELLNQDESTIDCGGRCQGCDLGDTCVIDDDCLSYHCSTGQCAQAPANACTDTLENHGETDIDCGGPCPGCDIGGACQQNADCMATFCVDSSCAQPPEIGTCDDGVRNQNEIKTDCGGMCEPCEPDRLCDCSDDEVCDQLTQECIAEDSGCSATGHSAWFLLGLLLLGGRRRR